MRMPALEWTQEQKENEETMYFLFHLKIKQTSDFSYTKAARPCPECGEDLYMKILRGNISSGLKGEIWGSKDTPILVIEYKCMKCHYISVEEEWNELLCLYINKTTRNNKRTKHFEYKKQSHESNLEEEIDIRTSIVHPEVGGVHSIKETASSTQT